jgi:hypothetical protein
MVRMWGEFLKWATGWRRVGIGRREGEGAGVPLPAYNLTRVLNIVGVKPLMVAIRA